MSWAKPRYSKHCCEQNSVIIELGQSAGVITKGLPLNLCVAHQRTEMRLRDGHARGIKITQEALIINVMDLAHVII